MLWTSSGILFGQRRLARLGCPDALDAQHMQRVRVRCQLLGRPDAHAGSTAAQRHKPPVRRMPLDADQHVLRLLCHLSYLPLGPPKRIGTLRVLFG